MNWYEQYKKTAREMGWDLKTPSPQKPLPPKIENKNWLILTTKKIN